MTFPYGFDPSNQHMDKDPWINLKTIDEFLQDREPVPPDLAAWLGLAIRFSNRDPNEFLKRLGLKGGRGRKHHIHNADAWLEWGGRVAQLEDNGANPEAALKSVMDEYASAHPEGVTRSQLQKWCAVYRKAWEEAHASN
jgi:hypothetical protein